MSDLSRPRIADAVTFSVIIPTCDRNEDLARCLEAIGANDQDIRSQSTSRGTLRIGKPNLQYEVIVTDDGAKSSAESLVLERFPWARWIKGLRRGVAANRNFGASHAIGDWLAFVDDDCIPAAGWLEAYASAVATFPECGVFEGRTSPKGLQTRADQECPVNLKGGQLWGCNFAIRRQLFFDLQGFDERFPMAGVEDIDFQVRLEKRGCKIHFLPDALVQHPWRKKKDIRFYLRVTKSIGYFVSKHADSKIGFSEIWAIKRAIRAIVFEFPRNLIRFRDGSSFRVLYLELVWAISVFFELLTNRLRLI